MHALSGDNDNAQFFDDSLILSIRRVIAAGFTLCPAPKAALRAASPSRRTRSRVSRRANGTSTGSSAAAVTRKRSPATWGSERRRWNTTGRTFARSSVCVRRLTSSDTRRCTICSAIRTLELNPTKEPRKRHCSHERAYAGGSGVRGKACCSSGQRFRRRHIAWRGR